MKTNFKRQLHFLMPCSILQARHYSFSGYEGYFSDIGLNQRVRSICHMSPSFPINRIYNIINHIFMSFLSAVEVLGRAPVRRYSVSYIFNTLGIRLSTELLSIHIGIFLY